MTHAYTLIGMYDSPFVRRVAVTMHIYGLTYRHRAWSVFDDFDRVRSLNPLGRVPVLLLDEDEALIDSNLIIDHLDQVAGADRALTPPADPERRRVLKRVGIALGACEKAVALVYENHKREAQYRDPAWVRRLTWQVDAALDWIEADLSAVGDTLDQALLTYAVTWRFMCEYHPEHAGARANPRLAALGERLEASAPFLAVPFDGS